MNQSRVISFLQFQLPAIAWALFIFTVSSIPSTKLPSLIHYTDKMIHAGVFFVLCWFLHVAFRFQGNIFLQSKSLWLALIITSLFGMSDEYHQLFTPGRSTDFFDWMADSIGAALYVTVYLRFKFYEMIPSPTEER